MRFHSLGYALTRFRENHPPKVVIPYNNELSVTFGRQPDTSVPTPDAVMRWGDGSMWGVTPITAYVFPNQLIDPDGEWV